MSMGNLKSEKRLRKNIIFDECDLCENLVTLVHTHIFLRQMREGSKADQGVCVE